MQQYSPKNQAFLLTQMPTATDVRPFKAWKAVGRSVRKGEKALRVWIPKLKGETADPATLTETERERRFVRGPVFDISQTKEAAPRHRRQAQSAASENRYEQAWTDYAAAIDAGDIPDTLDFADWYELREETTLLKATTPTAGTIATLAGVVIAEYQHIDAYAPIGGGSQELDELEEQETAGAVSDPLTADEHAGYQSGRATGEREYRQLPESTIRTMHASLAESLSRPTVYPAGITGRDRAHLTGRYHAYSYLLNGCPDACTPAGFHGTRRWNVHQETDAATLAAKLTEHSWCLCQGFALGHALFLNDATREDGAGEYAIIDTRTMQQIESITFSWCKPEKARQYIEAAAAGLMCAPWPMGTLDPKRLDYGKPYPHCQLCR